MNLEVIQGFADVLLRWREGLPLVVQAVVVETSSVPDTCKQRPGCVPPADFQWLHLCLRLAVEGLEF